MSMKRELILAFLKCQPFKLLFLITADFIAKKRFYEDIIKMML